MILSRIKLKYGNKYLSGVFTQQGHGLFSQRREQMIHTANSELAESLHQFITYQARKPSAFSDCRPRPKICLRKPHKERCVQHEAGRFLKGSHETNHQGTRNSSINK